MKVCETCGKQISALNAYKTNGIIQCYDCAMKTSEERLKKGSNAFNVGYKINEQSQSENVKTINQVISDANKIVYENVKQNDSSFWIRLLKTAAIIEFIISIIAGIVGAIGVGGYYGDFEGFLIGLVVFIGIVCASIIVFATEMVFLNLAEDVSAIRKTITKNQEK